MVRRIGTQVIRFSYRRWPAVGSLFGLSPVTSYEVKFVSGSTEISGSFTTQPDELQFVPLTFSWYAAQLSNANLVLINKTGLTQFRLTFARDDNDDLGSDYVKFFSGNASSANQPQLIITYYVP